VAICTLKIGTGMKCNDLFIDVVDPQSKSDNSYLYVDPTIIAAAAGAVSTGVGQAAQALRKTDEGQAIVQKCGRRMFKIGKKAKRRFDECAAQVSADFESRRRAAENQLKAAREGETNQNLELAEKKQNTIIKVSLIFGVVVILGISAVILFKK
jgi:hypothetical protein